MAVREISQRKLNDQINSKGIVVLLFYTNWSGSCQILFIILEQVASEIKDSVRFFKVDANKNHNLIIKNHITSIPSILLYKNGKVTKLLAGIISKTLLINEIEKLI